MRTSLLYPKKISLARTPTPLVPLDRLSDMLGGPRVWLKCDDETGFLLSGNKVRKLEYLLAEAQDQEADTIVTCGGIQSNHCRATAVAAKRLGLRCILILRDDDYVRSLESKTDGNLLVDDLVGADIHIYPAKQYSSELGALIDHHVQETTNAGGVPYVIPTGGSNATGLWGYISGYEELTAQLNELDISPGYVFCATGSAGTQAGLTLGSALVGANDQIVGVAVCDSKEYFQNKILHDVGLWLEKYPSVGDLPESLLDSLQISTIDDYIGPGYARPYAEMLETMKMISLLEGVILDPVYTGKAFHGMVEEIKCGNISETSDIVFVHTGGMFGVFPYKQFLST